MPQRTQHYLVHVLLLWTIVLSIMQVVLIICYFTVGHQGTLKIKPNNTTPMYLLHSVLTLKGIDHPKLPSKQNPTLERGKMLTFQATGIYDKGVKWVAEREDRDLFREGLTVQKDGYYFLNLQVTLCACKDNSTVTLKFDDEILLQGRIPTNTCSTGLLGKVEELSAGKILKVTIDPKPNGCIKIDEFATHLDIIYMP